MKFRVVGENLAEMQRAINCMSRMSDTVTLMMTMDGLDISAETDSSKRLTLLLVRLSPYAKISSDRF